MPSHLNAILVGSGLLAKAVDPPTWMLNVPAFSRASPLPEVVHRQARRAISSTDAAADNNPAQQRLKIRFPRGSANQRRMCRPM